MRLLSAAEQFTKFAFDPPPVGSVPGVPRENGTFRKYRPGEQTFFRGIEPAPDAPPVSAPPVQPAADVPGQMRFNFNPKVPISELAIPLNQALVNFGKQWNRQVRPYNTAIQSIQQTVKQLSQSGRTIAPQIAKQIQQLSYLLGKAATDTSQDMNALNQISTLTQTLVQSISNLSQQKKEPQNPGWAGRAWNAVKNIGNQMGQGFAVPTASSSMPIITAEFNSASQLLGIN